MHPWQTIYAREGRYFSDPFPGFDEVVRILLQAHCKRILDLGCGSGRYSVQLAKRGFSAFGADISLTGLRLSKDWAQQEMVDLPIANIDFREGLPFATSTFDGLLSTQVIHHAKLHEIRTAIREINRILRPGALAFVSVAGRWHQTGPFVEVEPSTFIPQTGPEAGLPHHIFSEADLRHEFLAFAVREITLRDDGKVLAIWATKV